jgi:hypothetical protein
MQSSCLSGHYFAADSLLALSSWRYRSIDPNTRSQGAVVSVRNFVMIEVTCQIEVIGIPTLPGIVEICLNVARKN